MLVVRDLSAGPKRTTELMEDLHPISSRTLMGRLREMEQDKLVLRNNYGGLPRRVEYELTERGRLLIPLLDALMKYTGTVVFVSHDRYFIDKLFATISLHRQPA